MINYEELLYNVKEYISNDGEKVNDKEQLFDDEGDQKKNELIIFVPLYSYKY